MHPISISHLDIRCFVLFFLVFTIGTGGAQTASAQQAIANPLHAFALNRDKNLIFEGSPSVLAITPGTELYYDDAAMITARLGEVVIKSRALRIQRPEFGDCSDLRIERHGLVSHAEVIQALADVVISYKDLTAVGERLVIDMRQGTAMLSGEVVLWLGSHIMRGGRLFTNMQTGASRLDGVRTALGDRIPVNPKSPSFTAKLLQNP